MIEPNNRMKAKSEGKSNPSKKKSKPIQKKKNSSSSPKNQADERRGRTKLIDPATQTTKKSNEVYAIDSIEGFMNFNSNPFYLVHWKGYDRSEDMTWEEEKDIDNCDSLINKFWLKRFSINNSKALIKAKNHISQETIEKDGSNKITDSDSEIKTDTSDNESIEGHGFDIIKSQYEEIIRLKKERKDYLKQIKYFKQIQELNDSKSNEKINKKKTQSQSLNTDVDVSNTDDSDVFLHLDEDYDSENFLIDKDDNYDTEIKPKLDSGYTPDYVFDSRCQNSKQQFLVKWSGFNDDEASWVNEDMIDDQYVKIYRLIYCSPMVKQMRIVFMNEKKKIHQYNVLLSNGQLVWLSEGQIKPKLLHEFKSKKNFYNLFK